MTRHAAVHKQRSQKSATPGLHAGEPRRSDPVAYRPARLSDVAAMVALINGYAAEHIMLPKSAEAIALAIEDFVIATDRRGRLLGCAALREYSPSLAEVSSVAVAREAHGLGIGSGLVREVERLAAAREVGNLFALTLTTPFFDRLGYRVVDRALFPEKVQRDCATCTRRTACNETCVYRALTQHGRRAWEAVAA
jgi:amino-acid N-acetyltransferase